MLEMESARLPSTEAMWCCRILGPPVLAVPPTAASEEVGGPLTRPVHVVPHL